MNHYSAVMYADDEEDQPRFEVVELSNGKFVVINKEDLEEV